MRFDLELIKALGCNMLRKHVKVEPARYYYDCDRLGLIVWQDMPNGAKAVGDAALPAGRSCSVARRKDRNYRCAGREDPACREDFRRELQELVEHLYNFPCIGMWVPFNEGWGQFDARETADWLSKATTRPAWSIMPAAGSTRAAETARACTSTSRRCRVSSPRQQRAVVLSEFGGYSAEARRAISGIRRSSSATASTATPRSADRGLSGLAREAAPSPGSPPGSPPPSTPRPPMWRSRSTAT